MVRSMTGYGRFQQTADGMDITVEIKSVNHRYYEYSSRIPRAYGFLDDKLKSYIQRAISRGKVDVSVWIETVDAPGSDVAVNYTLADGYRRALQELAQRYGLADDTTAGMLARFPDVLSVHRAAEDEDAVWESVRRVTDEALSRFVAMREREGARLREDILSRAATILRAVEKVEERSPQTVKEHMEKVEARMRELLGDASVDEQRLLTEAAIFADKIAVAEETVRLRSHLEQLEHMLSGDEPVGRKLDFLVQEINREANTIGSKAQDVTLARIVVDIKAEIEKIREQIQNIERIPARNRCKREKPPHRRLLGPGLWRLRRFVRKSKMGGPGSGTFGCPLPWQYEKRTRYSVGKERTGENETHQYRLRQYGFCQPPGGHCQPGIRANQADYPGGQGTRDAD